MEIPDRPTLRTTHCGTLYNWWEASFTDRPGTIETLTAYQACFSDTTYRETIDELIAHLNSHAVPADGEFASKSGAILWHRMIVACPFGYPYDHLPAAIHGWYYIRFDSQTGERNIRGIPAPE